MKELTKAEEQIMQILWKINKGFINDIIEHMPEPKPAYNTASTITRILETKGFVAHRAYGKTHEYYPLITKEQYSKGFLQGFMKRYFSNSYKNFVSFFSKNEDLTVTELEEIIRILKDQLDNQKKK